MSEEGNSHFELFLTADGQNRLKTPEMVALMQLLRIVNALRFQMTLLLATKEEKHSLFRLRSQLEIYAVMASLFKEATKEFFNNQFKVLQSISEDKQLKLALKEYDDRTRAYKNDEVLNIIDYIRNNFSFHMKSKLFEDYIVDGQANKDMLIGISISGALIDTCYIGAYDAFIFQISRMAESLEDKSKVLEWLFDKIFNETHYFCDLLEKFGGSVVKKYGGKRLITS